MKRWMRAARLLPRLVSRVPQAWRVWRKAGWRGVRWELHRKLGARNDYAQWVHAHDTVAPQELAELQGRAAAFASEAGPLISVLMPCYNPDPQFLRAAIASVKAQLYPHWELCIADDVSPAAGIRKLLAACAAEDPRIKVAYRGVNGHISAASNSALELVTGDWIALMDHDDLLSQDALLQVAECIRDHAGARLIYSDEDKVDGSGRRSDPYFKPDWNLDLFRSHNMFSHLGVLHSDLVREVGGFRPGFEGSQDWDLVLRCVERVAPEQIVHIPRVLYHWRIHEESTARSMAAKPYAAVAGEKALDAHFQRLGTHAQAEYIGHGYRVHFALPSPPPLVTLIIPTRNAQALVRRCIGSVQRLTDYPHWEIILVDNGSDDPAALAYFRQLAQEPRIRVVRDERPFNYAALNNAAVALARGDVVALLNNDIEVISPGWLSEMVALAMQPGVGAVGSRLWYPDGTLQHGGVVLGVGGVAGHAHKALPRGLHGYAGRAALTQSFSAVTAACLVVRKALYEEVGGLDEVRLPVAFNDVDFCLRLRAAGYRNVWTPYAELLHHESATRGDDVAPEKQARFSREVAWMRERWGALIDGDPAYNPNLTLASEDFGLAWPPRCPR